MRPELTPFRGLRLAATVQHDEPWHVVAGHRVFVRLELLSHGGPGAKEQGADGRLREREAAGDLCKRAALQLAQEKHVALGRG
jgi:hypothetical protein